MLRFQVREKTVHEMRAERDTSDTNGLLLHLRTQVMNPDTLHPYSKGSATRARTLVH